MVIVDYMKYSIILFFTFFTLQACGQNDSQLEEVNFLSQFYKDYVKNWENEKELDSLKSKNLSKELIEKLASLNVSEKLDYDPLVNAQDVSEDLLKTIKISPLKDSGYYKVCYTSLYETDSICTTLQILKTGRSYLINDIKVNDIQSILKLRTNTVKDVDYTDNDDFHVNTDNQSIIISYKRKKEVYENLFINEMSISTTIEKENDKEFSLIYELNASVNKIKEKYKFQYLDDGLYLIFKESVKFGQEGLATNRVYFNKHNMKGQTYEDIQLLGNNLNNIFENKNPIFYLYDFKHNPFGKISYVLSIEDFYIIYPEVNNGRLTIDEVEEANNQAYYLEENNIHNESIFLLNQIIFQYPDRITAYLNVADSYWGLGNQEEAKKNYEKYISMMKSQHKDLKRIPQRVYDRIK